MFHKRLEILKESSILEDCCFCSSLSAEAVHVAVLRVIPQLMLPYEQKS